jgi:hypothetical protein
MQISCKGWISCALKRVDYLIAVASLVNNPYKPVTLLLKVVNEAKITIATKAAISAYSIAVVPSSCFKNLSNFFISLYKTCFVLIPKSLP